MDSTWLQQTFNRTFLFPDVPVPGVPPPHSIPPPLSQPSGAIIEPSPKRRCLKQLADPLRVQSDALRRLPPAIVVPEILSRLVIGLAVQTPEDVEIDTREIFELSERVVCGRADFGTSGDLFLRELDANEDSGFNPEFAFRKMESSVGLFGRFKCDPTRKIWFVFRSLRIVGALDVLIADRMEERWGMNASLDWENTYNVEPLNFERHVQKLVTVRLREIVMLQLFSEFWMSIGDLPSLSCVCTPPGDLVKLRQVLSQIGLSGVPSLVLTGNRIDESSFVEQSSVCYAARRRPRLLGPVLGDVLKLQKLHVIAAHPTADLENKRLLNCSKVDCDSLLANVTSLRFLSFDGLESVKGTLPPLPHLTHFSLRNCKILSRYLFRNLQCHLLSFCLTNVDGGRRLPVSCMSHLKRLRIENCQDYDIGRRYPVWSPSELQELRLIGVLSPTCCEPWIRHPLRAGSLRCVKIVHIGSSPLQLRHRLDLRHVDFVEVENVLVGDSKVYGLPPGESVCASCSKSLLCSLTNAESSKSSQGGEITSFFGIL